MIPRVKYLRLTERKSILTWDSPLNSLSELVCPQYLDHVMCPNLRSLRLIAFHPTNYNINLALFSKLNKFKGRSTITGVPPMLQEVEDADLMYPPPSSLIRLMDTTVKLDDLLPLTNLREIDIKVDEYWETASQKILKLPPRLSNVKIYIHDDYYGFTYVDQPEEDDEEDGEDRRDMEDIRSRDLDSIMSQFVNSRLRYLRSLEVTIRTRSDYGYRSEVYRYHSEGSH